MAETDARYQTMYSPLVDIIRREPVTVPPQISVLEALRVMENARVGSLVISEGGKPLGVFTLRDLLSRVALGAWDREQPIAAVMSRENLVSLGAHASAYQAALAMARHRLRHILVTDGDGMLLGVVSQNDLYAVRHAGVKEVSGQIRDASDLASLQTAAAGIAHLARRMLAQGTGAELLTQFISSLNDILTLRVIELTLPDFALPPVDWCWIALGSEGRFEQTFSTDQDNGIIFDCPEGGPAETLRAALLPFAQEVNRKLDACGFPLCRGNIMAGNPQWCLSLQEWRGRFSGWVYEAQPTALLNATIFFDFRPLYGEEKLSQQLRDSLLAITGANPAFLRQMAVNALQCSPPLGLIRTFVFDSAEFPHTIDLKLYGTRPFVDAARIFALGKGIADTGTAQRLRAAAAMLQFQEEDVAALIDAFYFIQLLRLRRQQAAKLEPKSANRLDPASLNGLERQTLKHAFRQARKLQQKLQLDYRL